MNARTDLCARLIVELGERAPTQSAEVLDQLLFGWILTDYRGMVLMTKGDEVHIAIPRTCRAHITRGVVLGALMPLVEKFGKATTLVAHGHIAGNRFVERLGFKRVGETPTATRYELKKVAYA